MAYIDHPTRRPRLRGYSSLEILLVLAYDVDHGRAWHHFNLIKSKVSFYEITEAIAFTRNANMRARLCYLLGRKCWQAKQKPTLVILPTLIKCLNDASATVRLAAADALGCTLNPLAGPPLMRQMEIEDDRDVKAMITGALSAVQYRPAIPILIDFLSDSDPITRASVARTLGELRAHEAAATLREAWDKETEDLPKYNMECAFQEIEGIPVWDKHHS